MKKTVYGGGYWNCSKCGRTIEGSSIYHECSIIEQNQLTSIVKKKTPKEDASNLVYTFSGLSSYIRLDDYKISLKSAIIAVEMLIEESENHLHWRKVKEELLRMKKI